MKTASIDITRALAIDGWMSEPELVWLAEQAQQHRVIVEIGSYLGRSTRVLLDNTDGLVYAVDDWKGPRDVYMSKEEREALYVQFMDNIRDKWMGHCIVLRMDHQTPVSRWDGPQIDMVFLDGSHEYQDVKWDIQMWRPKIGKGGLLCGHDADLPAVRQAVMEELGEADVVDDTSIWWVKV